MYETMVYWETALTVPDQPPVVLNGRDPAALGGGQARHHDRWTGPGRADDRAGPVDECQIIVCPIIGGGGTRFVPD